MSSRVSFVLAVLLLLVGAGLRMWHFSTLPAGMHAGEIVDVQVTETIRQGDIEVFYDLGGQDAKDYTTLSKPSSRVSWATARRDSTC